METKQHLHFRSDRLSFIWNRYEASNIQEVRRQMLTVQVQQTEMLHEPLMSEFALPGWNRFS